MLTDRPGVCAPAEREHLDEQSFVGTLRHAVLQPALFTQIRRLDARPAFVHLLSLRVPIILQLGAMSTDDRQAAQQRLTDLLAVLKGIPQQDQLARLVDETEALARAVAAFHLEGIRFRIYNVDRMVSHPPVPLPAETASIVADVRRHLEAAGFHTRSHQAPT